jgi:hypothetical protein
MSKDHKGLSGRKETMSYVQQQDLSYINFKLTLVFSFQRDGECAIYELDFKSYII